jgi:hypothetical protein
MVMDMTRINMKKYSVEEYIDSIVFLTMFTIEHMLIPGKVENWNNFVEMGHFGITQLPLTSVFKISQALQKVLKCRLAHCFVLNPPSTIYYIWKLGKPFIDKVTQDKIKIVKGATCPEMLTLHHHSQVEEKFGGSAPNVEVFWPPSFSSSIFMEEKSISEEIVEVEIKQELRYEVSESEDSGKRIVEIIDECVDESEESGKKGGNKNEDREEEEKKVEGKDFEGKESEEIEYIEKYKIEVQEKGTEEEVEGYQAVINRSLEEIAEGNDKSEHGYGCGCSVDKCAII